MRSQGCTIQQALTSDAAAVVKQAVALAKRRGHAQVTPLHVAHTMLSVSSGLLRAACLQSHSHPLQCRALELCFNVALNRLPTSTSGPMLGPHSAQHHHPTIANALVAAFKRAQAHQRRGSIENQQQPLLAVKIELEQLIISILDDPSVSRVMREAGFSSTLVKGKVEQAVSVETPSNNNNTNTNNNNNIIKPKDSNNNSSSCNNNTNNSNSFLSMAQTGSLRVGKPRLICDQGVEKNSEDVISVIESLVNKRKRNSVIVGECITTLEGLVRGVMDRVEKGEVPEALKEVKFIHMSFSSFGHLSKEEVEQRVGELKCLVKTCCVDNNKGVILYLDDLKWVNEFRASNNNILVDQHQPRRSYYYCPIEHMIIEIGKLANNESSKLWLLGIATFQTYMRCKGGQSSLEALWSLHAITIPAGSLGLSLLPESDLQSPLTSKKLDMNGSNWLMLESGGVGGGGDNYRPSGTVNMESQSRQSSACNSDSTNSSLPSWLQQYKDENSKKASSITNNDQDSVPVKDLCKRWGSICTSSSSPSFERTLSFSSISPSSSASNFSYDLQHSRLQPTTTHQSFEPNNFWVTETSNNRTIEPPITSFTMSMSPNNDHHHLQRRHATFISSNPNSTPTSTSSSDIMDPLFEPSQCLRFKEYTTENLKILCNALEQEVPRQKDIIMDIVSTILHCRAGKSQRKSNEQNNKEETWLFFQGIDIEAKEKIARELARLIFGSSQDKFISIGLSSFSSTRVVDSLEDSRNKRLRDEQSCSYTERFAEAVSNDPHRVFFVEDIEQVDYCSQMGVKKAIERGKISKHSSDEEVSFGDAIIILSCERFSSRSRACSPSMKHKVDVKPQEDCHDNEMKNMENSSCLDDTTTSSPSLSLDLNISINDDDDNEITGVESSYSVDEIGLLASVDKCITFKSHQEL